MRLLRRGNAGKAEVGARPRGRGWWALGLAVLMMVLSVALLIPVYFAWRTAIHEHWFRSMALWTAIACGLFSAMILVMGMWVLDRPMKNSVPPFYMRCLLKGMKRVFLVLELGTMGLALAGGYWLAFGFKIPGK